MRRFLKTGISVVHPLKRRQKIERFRIPRALSVKRELHSVWLNCEERLRPGPPTRARRIAFRYRLPLDRCEATDTWGCFMSYLINRSTSAEAYLMSRMLSAKIREFEQHVAQSPHCAEIVENAKAELPASLVHQTEDGPVHLWASADKQGGWKARIWSRQLAGAHRFETMAEANRYLRDSFAQMFPEHLCAGGCQSLGETAQERAAAGMYFWDYSE